MMLKLEEPDWSKILIIKFGVNLSLPMANYDAKEQANNVFCEFYNEAVRWCKLWQAKLEVDQ
jgi:hypothetical protein